MAGKDDAFLPELVEKGGTDVIEEVVPMSVKVGVSVDLSIRSQNSLSVSSRSQAVRRIRCNDEGLTRS